LTDFTLYGVIACICLVAGLAIGLGHPPILQADRYAIEHLTPGTERRPLGYARTSDDRVVVFTTDRHPGIARKAHFVWGPFSRLFGTMLVVLLCAVAAWRRRTAIRPAVWLAGYAVANVAAGLMQAFVRRPPIVIHDLGVPALVTTYHASFPSGYTVRAVFAMLVAFAIARTLGLVALGVVLVVTAAVVVGGSHLLTDVVAGTIIAVGAFKAADAAATAVEQRRL
jgi:membrane-associated phospholipid phosphatase